MKKKHIKFEFFKEMKLEYGSHKYLNLILLNHSVNSISQEKTKQLSWELMFMQYVYEQHKQYAIHTLTVEKKHIFDFQLIFMDLF